MFDPETKATVSPLSLDPDERQRFSEICSEEWQRFASVHRVPPPSCEYCTRFVFGHCILTNEKKFTFENCDSYEWNQEPEDEEQRQRRLHPELFMYALSLEGMNHDTM